MTYRVSVTISQRMQVTLSVLRFWAARGASWARWVALLPLLRLDEALWRSQDARMTRLGYSIERAGWLGLSRLYRHPAMDGVLRAGLVRCAV